MNDKPQAQYVRLGDLKFDPRYQRTDNINQARVNDIAKNYDPAAVGAIYVNRREDGTLFVVDGQHRVLAMRKKHANDIGENYQMLALVYDGLTIVEEARLFWHQTKRTAVSATDQYTARVAAEDPRMCEIREIVESHGLKISRNRGKNQVGFIKQIEDRYKKHGAEFVDEAIGIMADGCRMGSSYPTVFIFIAICELLRNYDPGQYDVDTLIKAIAKLNFEAFNKQAAGFVMMLGSRDRSLCQALVIAYNKTTKGGKLPDVNTLGGVRKRSK